MKRGKWWGSHQTHTPRFVILSGLAANGIVLQALQQMKTRGPAVLQRMAQTYGQDSLVHMVLFTYNYMQINAAQNKAQNLQPSEESSAQGMPDMRLGRIEAVQPTRR